MTTPEAPPEEPPDAPPRALVRGRGGSGLVVSTHFPRDPSFVAGVHRRLDVLVKSLASVTDNLTVLFLVWTGTDCSEHRRRAYEDYLRARWGTPINLRLAPVREPPVEDRRVFSYMRWRNFIAAAFSFNETLSIRPLYNDGAKEAISAALAERPRIVLAHRLDVMSVLLRVWHETAGARVIFDLDDIEHVAIFRRLLRDPEWPAERLQMLHLPALISGERRAIRLAAATLVCSQSDKRYLERRFAGAVHEIPNSTPISDSPMPPSAERTVLFVGTFAYPPNVHAADRLIKHVWPRILTRVPDARLIIVGKDPETLATFAASQAMPSIKFSGFVDDLRATYARTRVICCPIGVGGGTRVKIVEAAGFARPVVTTPLGGEGLVFQDGTEIVLRERNADLAEACIDLLLNPEAARQMGLAAWQRARGVYDRALVTGKLQRLYDDAPRETPVAGILEAS